MSPSNTEAIIKFDPRKCTQCHGCEIACKTWRGLEYGVQYRRVLNQWQAEYPQAACGTVSVACLHCVEPQCMKACPEGAISKQAEDGFVGVDRDLCTGCRLCLEACPFDVPQFGVDEIMVKCDLCRPLTAVATRPPCVDTCPGEALTLLNLSQQEKRAHEQAMEKVFSGT